MSPSRSVSARLERPTSRSPTREVFLGCLRIVRAHDLQYGREDDPQFRKADLESHSNLVAVECYLVARAYGLSRRFACLLALAGLLHDLGKTEMVEYLQRDPFTHAQKQRKTLHARISRIIFGTGLESLESPRMRALLEELLVPIDCHHHPWEALNFDTYRGAIFALILNLCDAYHGIIEPRGVDHPGETPAEAIRMLEDRVRNWIEYEVFGSLPEQIVAILRRLHLDD